MDKKTTPRKSTVISSIEGKIRPVIFMGVRIATRSYGEIHFDRWDEEMPVENIFCIPIKVNKSPYTPPYLDKDISGLVLQEVRDGVFVRLGHFEADRETCMPFLKQAQRRKIIIV